MVFNSVANGWCTRYCVGIPDGEHMLNTVTMWVADHSFGFYQNKYGKINSLMNFSKAHFKCMENNHDICSTILHYYNLNEYQRVPPDFGVCVIQFIICIIYVKK